MANLKNNITFNKATQKGIAGGFYSRVLFSCVDNTDEIVNLMDYSDWYSNIDFDGIGDLKNSGNFNTFGNYVLPPKYWLPGKTIRISGNALAYGITELFGAALYLDMRFGIQGPGGSTTWLAIQNNNNNHIFVDGQSYTSLGLLPLSFETTIICSEIDTTKDPPMSFVGTGHFQYDRENWDVLGSNTERSYVPLNTGNTSIGVSDITYYTPSTSIMFNLYGSTINTFKLLSLLIEELA